MVGLRAARAKASDWRNPAEYRQTDQQTRGWLKSASGLTSRRGEARSVQLSLWHITLILAAGKGQPDSLCQEATERTVFGLWVVIFGLG